MPVPILPELILRGATRDYPIAVLFSSGVEATAPGERELLRHVLPPWQRDEVWEPHRKRAFIEGIFLGLGTGYYVANGMEWEGAGAKPMAGWLIDGQQRLTALRDFVVGDLAIFEGVRFADLDEATRRRRFMNVVFPCIELPYTDDEHLLRRLYERLNFGGVAHTRADMERLRATEPLRPRER
ncbi:DUF262 domain-containing protein [Ramlibacter sp. AN1133]|uniref:DUF262 domain-containing protein n=1 Tax=Ramlibacter sp. AN1133 TaxID=3133429 RepID=UPI0030BF2DD8